MQTVKLPVVIAIAIVAAIVGGAATHVLAPSTNPEVEALLKRQVELAEQEATSRADAARSERTLFGTGTGVKPGGGEDFKPKW